MIETSLQRFISLDELKASGFHDEKGKTPVSQRALYKMPEEGAATTVRCAVGPDLDGVERVRLHRNTDRILYSRSSRKIRLGNNTG